MNQSILSLFREWERCRCLPQPASLAREIGTASQDHPRTLLLKRRSTSGCFAEKRCFCHQRLQQMQHLKLQTSQYPMFCSPGAVLVTLQEHFHRRALKGSASPVFGRKAGSSPGRHLPTGLTALLDVFNPALPSFGKGSNLCGFWTYVR